MRMVARIFPIHVWQILLCFIRTVQSSRIVGLRSLSLKPCERETGENGMIIDSFHVSTILLQVFNCMYLLIYLFGDRLLIHTGLCNSLN